MPLSIPDLDTLHRRILDDHAGYLPDDDTSAGSDVWFRTRVLALLAWQQLYAVRSVEADLLPDTATGAFLDRLGRIYGVERKGATPARKASALRVTGAEAAEVPMGAELVHVSGLRFQVGRAAQLDSTRQADVDVVAIDVGAATRLDAGQVLKFVSPPAGIDAQAELQRALDEDGADEEPDAAYRVRVLDRIAQPGMGGNANDYRTWALEQTGIARAYVYPLRAGRGTVDLAALHAGRGAVRALSADERRELAEYIDGLRPVSMRGFRVLETPVRAVDVELAVELLPGSGLTWDWSDAGGPLVVAGWEPETRLLTLADARPSQLRPGARISIAHSSGGGTGEQLEVERLGPGPAELVLARAPAEPILPGDLVWSGGDIVEPVRHKLLAFFDELGPAVGRYGVGDWLDQVEPQQLLAIALQVRGVRRGEVVSPAATIEPADPAYPNDGAVELLVPGRVLVRRL